MDPEVGYDILHQRGCFNTVLVVNGSDADVRGRKHWLREAWLRILATAKCIF